MPPAPPTLRPVQLRPVRLGRWPWVLAVVLVLFYGMVALTAVAVVGFFGVGHDTRVVRDSLAESFGGRFDKQIELRAGRMSFGLARWVAGYAELEPEIGALLGGMRHVEVGVYRVEDASRIELLQRSDHALGQNGWERVVQVLDDRDAAAVYTRIDPKRPDALRVCAVVLTGRDLIIGSVQSDLTELVETLAERMEGRRLGARSSFTPFLFSYPDRRPAPAPGWRPSMP